ncbi:unnamed protein product [Nesidiocoris tenuis]|uniref:Uncharacterized protein n=1 Tax=Nesidiocoris tenuis TaxID=355587 RepID=A0A6H5FVA8_9HEMI|nr:unnamed protein product [Nesidiocoris tenuis]CAA9994061.1 unnamed protein product [Nesidiocoris tenuis]
MAQSLSQGQTPIGERILKGIKRTIFRDPHKIKAHLLPKITQNPLTRSKDPSNSQGPLVHKRCLCAPQIRTSTIWKSVKKPEPNLDTVTALGRLQFGSYPKKPTLITDIDLFGWPIWPPLDEIGTVLVRHDASPRIERVLGREMQQVRDAGRVNVSETEKSS